jgi:hypothetical protein
MANVIEAPWGIAVAMKPDRYIPLNIAIGFARL